MSTKAITDFSRYTDADLAPAAQAIHDKMDESKAIFSNPRTSLADLQGFIANYTRTLGDKTSRDSTAVVAFKAARRVLERALGGNGDYVNSVADGDATKVVASGYPSYETTGRHPNTAPPAAPANLRLRQGEVSGSLLVRYQPSRPTSINLVQTCLADPNVEANWKMAGMFSGGKATLTGFIPGTVVWVRVATAGLRGVMGAWSDPAKLMVI